jgi:exonuclease SbcC
MIDSIELKNFRCHKDTTLSFHPGINAIIGPSDSGKSTILRGLEWLLYNSPSGEKMISHWNKKDNGGPIEPTTFLLTTGKWSFTRIRKPGFNGYIINGDEKSALGKGGVPQELKDVLKIEKLNFAAQFDKPFLLFESSGDIAKYLNSLIDLSIIDETLSASDSRKTTIKKDLLVQKMQLVEAEKELNKLSWLKDAAPLLEKMEVLEKKEREIAITSPSLSLLLNSIQEKELEKKGIKKIIKLMKHPLEEGIVLLPLIESKSIQYKNLSALLESITMAEEEKSIYKERMKKLQPLEKLEDYFQRLIPLENKIRSIIALIKTATDSKMEMVRYTGVMNALKKEFPALCPVCGGPLGDKHDLDR